MTHAQYPDVLPVLTQVCTEHFRRRFEHDIDAIPGHGDQVLARGDDYACRYGPATWEVAAAYGHTLTVTRRQLIKALERGVVLADGRGGGRGISWWPVGLAAQLKEIRA